jgi:hypothetical protein
MKGYFKEMKLFYVLMNYACNSPTAVVVRSENKNRVEERVKTIFQPKTIYVRELPSAEGDCEILQPLPVK